MAFNITDFLNNLDKFGKASVNKFEVILSIPSIMRDITNDNKLIVPIINKMSDYNINMVTFRAESVEIPGINLMAVDTNYLGVGPRIKQAYNVVLSDCGISFINDAEGILEGFFHMWFNLMYNFAEDDDRTLNPTFTSNYRSDVCCSILILKYDDFGNLINKYTMINCIPTLITPMEYSWENKNKASKFKVKFNFTNFAIN
jgi:hypothetical protein